MADEIWLIQLVSISVLNRHSRGEAAKEETWKYQAEYFIRKSYNDWKTRNKTLLVPNIEDNAEWIRTAENDSGMKAERSIILCLYELGKNKQLSMFITYNRNFSHLMKSREVGGEIKGIITGEHDIVLIHRTLGVIFIQVKNLEAQRPH